MKLLPDKMIVQFDVLGSLMKNRILCNVDSSRALMFKCYRLNRGDLKFRKEPSWPGELSSDCSHGPIFGHCRRQSHSGLFLRFPRYGTTPKHYEESANRSPSTRALSRI